MPFEMETIGTIRSCYRDKFTIPRQAGLVPAAEAILEISPQYAQREAFRGLEEFSHIWISFIFHKHLGKKWKPTVRPPRLGGNRRLGVFATRSSFRPNALGLSAVRLIDIEYKEGSIFLFLGGGDFLDSTPVIDIKPYLPYADALTGASGGFAGEKPDEYPVHFSEQAVLFCKSERNDKLQTLITQTLCYDPRPAYSKKEVGKIYISTLHSLEIFWKVEKNSISVVKIEKTLT